MRIAVEMQNADGNSDIWVIDTVRGTHTRLTTAAAQETVPLWTPDGTRIVFSSSEAGANALYSIAADGAGAATALTRATTNQGATSFLPDGGTIAFYDVGTAGNGDLFTLQPGGAPVRFTQTPFLERGPTFSPDGRWLAYSSNESGRSEVYVTPYPGPGGKVTISTTGGRSPRWSANGRELFFRDDSRMMVADVAPGAVFRAGMPRVLFEGSYQQELGVLGAHNYDVSADGQCFVMIAPQVAGPRPEDRPQIVVVGHWLEELKRLVPVR
jgi:Tol biopolymer transport system component